MVVSSLDNSDELSFPIGESLDNGRWKIRELIRGNTYRGQYRVIGEGNGIVTMAPPQKGDRDLFVAGLEWKVPRIASLLWAGRLIDQGEPFDVLIESEPKGVSLDTWDGNQKAKQQIAYQLAHTLRDVFNLGLVLGGLRPELVYVHDDTFTAIIPRAERFFANASEVCHGVITPFEEVYLSPEQLSFRHYGPPADVFSLGAILYRLFTGSSPFSGQSLMHRMAEAVHGHFGPLEKAGEFAPLLASMMAVEPADRPTIDMVCDALASNNSNRG